MRYRLNVTLLLAVLAGGLLLAGGGYAAWKYQLSRNADLYLKNAEEAEASGNLRGVASNLHRAMRIRKDNAEIADRTANAYADVSELDEAESKDIRKALGMMEAIVREYPTNETLRRRLYDKYVKLNVVKSALEHSSILLNAHPDDAELKGQRASLMALANNDRDAIRYCQKLVGYDRGTETFDVEKAGAPEQANVYRLLALMLRRTDNDPELADRVIEQMLEVNEKDALAHLLYGQYQNTFVEPGSGDDSIRKAAEIDPDDAGVILANSQVLLVDGEKEEAEKLLVRGVELHPDDIRLYQQLANTYLQNKNYEGAMKQFDAGIAATTSLQNSGLYLYKTRAQLDARDVEGVKASLDVLEKRANFPVPLLEYLKARYLMTQDKWFDASKELARLRPTLANYGDLGIELNLMLGLCYEGLGQLEKALESYELVIQSSPQNAPASLGVARIKEKLSPQNSNSADTSITSMINAELRKDEAEQDWQAFDEKVEGYGKRYGLNEATVSLLKAEVFVRRGMHEEARKLVRQAIKEDSDNANIWRMAVKLVGADPERGPVAALKMLDQVTEKFGDSSSMRLDRADLLMAIQDEAVADQLMDLTNNIDSLEKRDQVKLWQGLAQRFAQLRKPEARLVALNKVAELSPNSLSTLLDLFLTARSNDDDAAMKKAQDKILDVVGSEEDPTWLFVEANRLVSLHRRGETDGKLEKAAELIDRAFLKRPDWHQLSMIQAEIALLNGDKESALQSLDVASKKGRMNPVAMLQHVSLLVERGRYADAKNLLDTLNPAVRLRLLGRQYAEILINTGSIAEGFEAAKTVAKNGAEDLQTQLWFGQTMLRVGSSTSLTEEQRAQAMELSKQALTNAVGVDSESPEAWLALIGYFMANKDADGAEAALREAELALPVDQVDLVLARSYEMLGRWFDAENLYKKTLEDNPEELRMHRLLASFYLGASYPKDDKKDKAIPLINKILKAPEKDPNLASDQHVLWARRTASDLLSQTGDYQSLLDAERLLASNVIDGGLTEQDKLLMARILAPRPEPVSRVKAIQLLEDIRNNQPLNVQNELILGRLYFATGDWNATKRQMDEVIGRAPTFGAARASYIRMLLQRGGSDNLKEATRQLGKLVEIDRNAPQTLELVARVFTKNGKKKEAQRALRSMLPKDLNKVPVDQVLRVARLLADLDDLGNAEKLYQYATKRQPVAKLYLADFLGSKKDVEEALDLLESIRDEVGPSAVIAKALQILKARRDEVGNEYDARLQSWLTKAQREDPESVPLKMEQAELYDLEQKYAEAADLYRQLLKRNDLDPRRRAIVLNNLSYLLAITFDDQSTGEEAMGYVAEAIDYLGPTSDILDTRAMVYINLKQYDAAIKDLELAVTDNPTASKYFHKAQAHLLAGQTEAALEAWQQADEMGLSREDTPEIERDSFDKVKAQIDGLGYTSASL